MEKEARQRETLLMEKRLDFVMKLEEKKIELETYTLENYYQP